MSKLYMYLLYRKGMASQAGWKCNHKTSMVLEPLMSMVAKRSWLSVTGRMPTPLVSRLFGLCAVTH